MANSNGWGDGAANNSIGWGQGANNNIGWGNSHLTSWAGATDIVGIDADAQAFITAAAITDPVQINAINTLVEGMKTDGIWTKMKAVYPFVGGTASTHKWNLKDPRDLDAAFRLVFNGGWTHSSQGATPNGVNAYADTKFNTTTHQSVNNLSLSCYLRTSQMGSVVMTDIGNWATALARPLTNIQTNVTTRNIYCWDYTALGQTITTTNNASGMWGVSRIGTTSWESFQRNTSISQTTLANQTTLPNNNVYIGAANGNGTAMEFSVRQVAFAHCGDSLTNTEYNNLYTRVQAFQNSLNRAVI